MTTNKRENSPDQAHSVYSPSSMTRWIECSASPRLIQHLRAEGKIPADTDSDASRRGTFLHEVTSLLLGGHTNDAQMLAELDAVKHEETPESAMTLAREAAQHARDALFLFDHKLPADVHLERRYEIDAPLHIHGTADVSRVQPTLVDVVDFKFGAWKINARSNFQLAAYAFMAAQTEQPGLADDVPVNLTIVQPVLGVPAWHVDTWQTDMKEVRRMMNAATRAWQAGEDAFMGKAAPVYTPTESGCKFCPAKTHCPGLGALASQIVKEALNMDHLSDKQIADFYDKAKLIAGAVDKIEENVRAGTITDGFTTKPGAYRKVWAAVDSDGFQKLITEEGVAPASVMDPNARLPLGKVSKDIVEKAQKVGAIVLSQNKERVARDFSAAPKDAELDIANAPTL